MSKKTSAKQLRSKLRQSQLVLSFGPGSLLDLPDLSVVISGLEGWTRRPDMAIIEPRLTAKVERALGVTGLSLYPPPPARDDDHGAPAGVTAYVFPEWFIANAPDPDRLEQGVRSRPLVKHGALERGKYRWEGKTVKVTPIRFVQACAGGHLSDIHWPSFVHGDASCTGQLFLDERGTSGDLAETEVRCSCGKRKPLSAAVRAGDEPQEVEKLGPCQGHMPWLGKGAREACKLPNGKGGANRLLIRSASNAYFPQPLSVISIPEGDPRLRRAVDDLWETNLKYLESADELSRERRRDHVAAILKGFTDEQVWGEIARRTDAGPGAGDRPIKQAEIETLLTSPEGAGDDVPDGDFFARTLPADPAPLPELAALSRVVLVHRLREVKALIGFTRLDGAMADAEGEYAIGIQRAAIARDLSWVPAVENRGEGVFLAFDAARIAEWEDRPEVQARRAVLERGFEAWKLQHGRPPQLQMPSLPYWMLHGLSHLLITAVALECGYGASSIRERIYAGKGGYGILLHTGTSDSEGTLGGLVAVGRQIRRHLLTALEMGRLCSNDPVCAQHVPTSHEERHLHGAACHGCLLIAETSCEQFNNLLDRALLVPTVETDGAAFFR